jgi:hypothetical protein
LRAISNHSSLPPDYTEKKMKAWILVTFLPLLCLVQALSTLDKRSQQLVKRALPNYDKKWDLNDPAARDRYGRHQRGWYDMLLMISVLVAEPIDSAIFDKYFSASGDAFAVLKVLKAISGDPPRSGAAAFSGLTITDGDYLNKCNDASFLAYTSNAVQNPKFGLQHICPRAYKNLLLDEVKCDDLGDTVSYKMSTLGALILHEVVHFNAVGQVA